MRVKFKSKLRGSNLKKVKMNMINKKMKTYWFIRQSNDLHKYYKLL